MLTTTHIHIRHDSYIETILEGGIEGKAEEDPGGHLKIKPRKS